MPQIAMQMTLDGRAQPGNVVEGLRVILEEHPRARDDYKAAMFYYWRDYDGLGAVLGDRADAFLAWFLRSATSPKTLQNRTMEIQRENPDLDSSRSVRRLRNAQATQGVVK